MAQESNLELSAMKNAKMDLQALAQFAIKTALTWVVHFPLHYLCLWVPFLEEMILACLSSQLELELLDLGSGVTHEKACMMTMNSATSKKQLLEVDLGLCQIRSTHTNGITSGILSAHSTTIVLVAAFAHLTVPMA